MMRNDMARRTVQIVLAACFVLLASSWLPVAEVRGGRHGRATVGMDCAACHTPASWRVREALHGLQGFDHDLTGFPLRAGHARSACTQCHDGRTQLARACNSCHVDAHGGKLGQGCDKCHNASSFRSTDVLTLHSRTRLPLTGMHALVDCGDCHRRMSSDGYSSVPSQCFACHEADYRRPDLHPVHDGSRGDPPLPRNCAECHRSDAFAPAVIEAGRFLSRRSEALKLDPRAHDKSFLLSHGPHRGAPCTACHTELREPRWVRCTGCHAHSAQALAAQHPRLGTPADGSCTSCHAGGFSR